MIEVRWNPPESNNQSGYRIERKKSVDSWDDAAEFDADAPDVLFRDEALDPETSYDYRMLAFNDGGDSGRSDVMSGETLALGALEVPSNLEATAVSSSEIRLDRVLRVSDIILEAGLKGITDGGGVIARRGVRPWRQFSFCIPQIQMLENLVGDPLAISRSSWWEGEIREKSSGKVESQTHGWNCVLY